MKKDYDGLGNKKIIDHDLAIEEIRMEHRDMKDELDKQWKQLDLRQESERDAKSRKADEKKRAFKDMEDAE